MLPPNSRHLFALGCLGMKASRDALAVRCSWCSRFLSAEDFAKAQDGARLSHGICRECAGREFGTGRES